MRNYSRQKMKYWYTRKVIGYVFYLIIAIIVTIVFKVNLIAVFLLVISSLGIYLAELATGKYQNYEKGEIGEMAVEEELRKIQNIIVYPDFILNDGSWNIDFVIVSIGGVFAVEVKNYDGEISASQDYWYRNLNSKRQQIPSFSKQAKGAAFNLFAFLKNSSPDLRIRYVTPVIVLTNNYSSSKIKTDEKVKVTSVEGLFDLISQVSSNNKADLEKVVRILDGVAARL